MTTTVRHWRVPSKCSAESIVRSRRLGKRLNMTSLSMATNEQSRFAETMMNLARSMRLGMRLDRKRTIRQSISRWQK